VSNNNNSNSCSSDKKKKNMITVQSPMYSTCWIALTDACPGSSLIVILVNSDCVLTIFVIALFHYIQLCFCYLTLSCSL
jgi:hypothetical protein